MKFAATHFWPTFRELPNGERQAFRRFLLAYYPNEKIAIKVFEYLLENNSTILPQEQILYELAFERKFEGKKNEVKQVQNVFTDLKKYLMEFITWQEMKQRPEYTFALLDGLRRRGLTEVYQQQLEILEKRIQFPEKHAVSNYDTLVKFYHYSYYYRPEINLKDRSQEIKQLIDSLELYYYISMLKYTCELYSRGIVVQEGLGSVNAAQALNRMYIPEYANEPLVVFYQELLRLIQNDDPEAYLSLKSRLGEGNSFHNEELEALIMYLLNFAARGIRMNLPDAQREYYDLCKLGVQHKVFNLHGYFTTEPFMNIVNLACNLDDIKWVKAFVDQYGQSIAPVHQSDTLAYCNARICYAEHKYTSAIEHLKNVHFIDFGLSLQFRILQIRCYCDLDSKSPFIPSLLTALQQYVYSNKTMAESHKQSSLNFVRIVYRILEPKNTKEALLAELKSTPLVWAKDWLQMFINQSHKS